MRIVDWAEFKTLPHGTVYQEWEPAILGELQILGGTPDIDFVTARLTPQPVLSGTLEEGHPLRNEEMILAMPSWFGRDGLFDHGKRMWLIWEEEDRKRLAAWLLDPSAAASVQNDDDVLYIVPPQFVDRR